MALWLMDQALGRGCSMQRPTRVPEYHGHFGSLPTSRVTLAELRITCAHHAHVPHYLCDWLLPWPRLQVADLSTGPGAKGTLVEPAIPVPYPPPQSQRPALQPVGPGIWQFAGNAHGRDDARHFMGALQQVNPGLAVALLMTDSALLWE